MSSANANDAVVPAAYPPPVDVKREFIKHGLNAEDELIEVGVAIVGRSSRLRDCGDSLYRSSCMGTDG